MQLVARQQFGRYIPLESHLHRLDPSIKLVVFATVFASILLSARWFHLAYVGAYVLVLCVVSKVRLRFYAGSLKYFTWMFALSFAVNVIFPKGGKIPAFSFAALSIAGIFSVRLVLMIVVATLLTAVTCPSEIADSVLVLTRIKGRMGRKAAEFASLLSIALRFVPIMFEEAERIKAAQILRGQSTSGLRKRVQFVVGLIVPLVESSLRRATNLAFALEARCYGYRVPKSPGLRLEKREIAFGSSGFLMLLGLVMMR